MASDSGVEVLLVGLDAACESVLDRLFEADAIPTLESIVDRGTAGPLASQIPPWTASAWPSLYTGTNPGKHGVFGFLTFEGYDWDVVNATHVREPALWELLDHRGLSSVVVNVPVTHPPRPFEGALVPGYVAPESPTCHPEGLLEDLRDAIGEYRLYAPRGLDGPGERVEWYRRLARSRGAACRYLVDRFDPDFAFVQFQVTDTVFHECSDDFQAARAVYEAVDAQIDRVIDACDPQTVVVASDHGIGPCPEVCYVNDRLRQSGYVRGRRGGEGMPSWKSARWGGTADGAGDGRSSHAAILSRLVGGAASVGITAQRVGGLLARAGLLDRTLDHVPWDVVRAGTEQVDFAGSRAYVRSRTECGVRLNLAGREPDGVVPPEAYESVRSELVSLLRTWTTADGRPVFDRVVPREAVFHGPRTGDAVDVVTVPRDFDVFLQPRLFGDVPTDRSAPRWDHTLRGVVVAAGDHVPDDATIEDAQLFDVAPTVLSAMGVPLSDRMDGSPLPFCGPYEVDTYPTVEPRRRTALADEAVESRLRDLGYIDGTD